MYTSWHHSHTFPCMSYKPNLFPFSGRPDESCRRCSISTTRRRRDRRCCCRNSNASRLLRGTHIPIALQWQLRFQAQGILPMALLLSLSQNSIASFQATSSTGFWGSKMADFFPITAAYCSLSHDKRADVKRLADGDSVLLFVGLFFGASHHECAGRNPHHVHFHATTQIDRQRGRPIFFRSRFRLGQLCRQHRQPVAFSIRVNRLGIIGPHERATARDFENQWLRNERRRDSKAPGHNRSGSAKDLSRLKLYVGFKPS